MTARAMHVLVAHFFFIGRAHVFNGSGEYHAFACPWVVAIDYDFAVGNLGHGV
jgi:hypothetical protein